MNCAAQGTRLNTDKAFDGGTEPGPVLSSRLGSSCSLQVSVPVHETWHLAHFYPYCSGDSEVPSRLSLKLVPWSDGLRELSLKLR